MNEMTKRTNLIPIDEVGPELRNCILSLGWATQEQLTAARKNGKMFYRATKSGVSPAMVICYDQETGEPTHILVPAYAYN
jgi:hypothetical protein